MPFPYTSKGIQDNQVGKFAPLPVGIYTFRIVETDEKMTKNNDPMVNLKLEVADKNSEYEGKTVWHRVVFPKKDPVTNVFPQWAGIGIHFLKTISEPWENDFIVTPESWVNKIFKAKTKIGKDQNDNPRTEIAFVINDNATTDQDVPF